jgi:quercetin dioxygenase-like cupin family protein
VRANKDEKPAIAYNNYYPLSPCGRGGGEGIIMKILVVALISSAFAMTFWLTDTNAHPVGEQDHPDTEDVILLSEIRLNTKEETGSNRELAGPSESKGIASIEPRGIIELGGEFAAMEGRQLRARIFTVDPGGVVGIHTHTQRPGFAYIISGKIIEHRNDTAEPITHTAGSVAMEKSGVTHWWENSFDEPVKALVVDIFTPENK